MKSTTREEENNELQKEFYALAIYSCALVLGSDGFLSRHLLLQVRREPRGLLTERTPQRFFFFLFFFHSASGLSFSSYPCYTLWSLPGGSANGTVPWEPTVGIYWMRGKNISLTSMADGLSTVHPLHKAIGKFLENIIILHGMKGELCSSLLPRLYDKTQHNISTHHMWNKTWACILQLLKVRCICLDIWWQIKRT